MNALSCFKIKISLLLLTAGLACNLAGQTVPGNDEVQDQYKTIQHDIKQMGNFTRFSNETFRAESLIMASDRDPADVVLRRTTALLADLKKTKAARKLAPLEKQLADLQKKGAGTAVTDEKARRSLFEDVCTLRRQIAFKNPLLNFDKILFVKRNRATYDHMCDQYYGINARPGGGVYVLSDPFSPNAQVRNVLTNSVVTRGLLKGQKLETGSFVTPALSYDGKKILFAYVECTGSTAQDFHTDPSRGHWNEGRSYHIFKVNVDGSGLEQLTDGTWNDFSPCWMPDGRIVFISERRGGYLRCGRTCPTYTLFDMLADGSDIRCLSFHETNEWHPSVTHDGMIVFTRWDYVDRHGCTAHHPWIITPDGCDPRAIHGNYSLRNLRPDMELDVRSIPDSHRFTATAAPHHGQAFGSLVMVDPHVQDDDAMAPVKRITPDAGFPESQGGQLAYATAWPLSENYYLCVYDATAARGEATYNYGIYLLDSFGNKELIYRDPAIACNNPIPLRARSTPPVVPGKTRRVPADQPAKATVGVINVYKSLKPWPEGTKIKALRIYQILPLPIACDNIPSMTGIQIPQGSDSINLARAILGTVPVEEDGSAYFTVPARKEVFFQALDEKGMAITSMRSAAQFQPDEHALCQGCHEPKLGTPVASASTPQAMQRVPSEIKPDVDGTQPFSYPRLVQPVLNKYCLECHVKNKEKAPRLDAEIISCPNYGQYGKTTYFASYVSLAPKFGFYSYENYYRTTPGKFGARASNLYAMLIKGHHDVKLTPEDLHRITVWLDSCSIFYGVYEKEGQEAQRRGEIAKPTLE